MAAPIQAPHGEAARDKVANRLEVFLDEFGEAADEHAMRPRRRRGKMAPTQGGAVGRGEYAPGEARRFEEAGGQAGGALAAATAVGKRRESPQ